MIAVRAPPERERFNSGAQLERGRESYMRMTRQRASLVLVALATLLLAPTNIARGQEDIQRLRSPATVRGFIGGESHDSYLIRASEGQTMTVQISWRREHHTELGDNHAEFFVSESPDYDGDGQVKGKETDKGKRWSGKIPKTGNYYIYVNAHPTAHYTLRVTVR
jgi:hypothetical protein